MVINNMAVKIVIAGTIDFTNGTTFSFKIDERQIFDMNLKSEFKFACGISRKLAVVKYVLNQNFHFRLKFQFDQIRSKV